MKIPIKMLEGRRHYVAPCVLLVEGVLNGSGGPILYPGRELAASVPFWNGRPVVVYHPAQYGKAMSGNPDVFTRQRIGTLFNVFWDAAAKALKGEAWIDWQRVRDVDMAVCNALEKGETMEVSTGLFAEYETGQGTFGGHAYEGIARNHRPDHLAILPDQEGACSIADGAGLCRNSRGLPRPLAVPGVIA